MVIKMVIAFLDLLGFTHLVQTDLETARDNLAIFNEMVHTKFVDEKCYPSNTYNKENGEQEFAENSSITSFNYLISVSDSLIIGSNDPDLFVKQISNFISTIFIQYLEPFEKPFDDIKVVHSNMRATAEVFFTGFIIGHILYYFAVESLTEEMLSLTEKGVYGIANISYLL